jgi:hypothetical protein
MGEESHTEAQRHGGKRGKRRGKEQRAESREQREKGGDTGTFVWHDKYKLIELYWQ